MGQFKPKNRDFILQRMENRVIARSELTDLNDGSDVKQVLAAASREDDDAFFQMINLQDLFDIFKSKGRDLDERAKEFNPRLVTRNLARKASSEVVFSRTGTSGAVTIAIGSQVVVPASGSQAEIVYATTEEGTIADTFQDSNNVDIVALRTGIGSNVDPTTIIGFVAKPSGVDTVTNPSAITNGLDKESDDSFRQRIINQIAGLARAHVDGLEGAARSAVDPATLVQVKFANAVEDVLDLGNVTVYIDDGSGTAETTNLNVAEVILASALGGETTLFTGNKPIKRGSAPFVLRVSSVVQVEGVDYSLNPASGQINFLPANYPTGLTVADDVEADYTNFTGLIQQAQKVIDGDKGDRVNFPGFRAGGVLVRVLSPNIVQQIVTGNITVKSGFNQVDAATSVKAAISGYINGLGISDDVILNEIRERAMAVPGMFDVAFSAPIENQVILDNQLARIIAGNLTIA